MKRSLKPGPDQGAGYSLANGMDKAPERYPSGIRRLQSGCRVTVR
ncbi:hypothetical protein ACTHRH_02225 [Paenibacillus sp. SAFN-117]